MGTIFRRLGPTPALISNSAGNLYNPASGVFGVIRALHVVNKDSANHTFTLYLGGTGATTAGTEIFAGQQVLANNVFDWYGMLELGSSDFLVGIASAASDLIITLMGEEQLIPQT